MNIISNGVLMRDIQMTDLALALMARLAEQSGVHHFTCKLTHEQVCELLGKYDVQVTRKVGDQLYAKSFGYASDDEYTLEFREKHQTADR